VKEPFDAVTLEFPKDPGASGTWIGVVSDKQRYACLLNGAFIKHDRTPPYKESRGIMVLKALTYDHGASFKTSYDFTDMEPFTLILSNKISGLEELKWDGQQLYHTILDPKGAYIWASPTLYTTEDNRKKSDDFYQFLEQQNNNTPQELNYAAQVFNWHRTQSYQETASVIISQRLKTLSITQIVQENQNISIVHKEII